MGGVNLLFPITSGYLWYFSCYMLLMLFSPFINKGIHDIGKEQYSTVLIILLPICFVARLFLGINSCTLLTLIVIYLLGGYVKCYPSPCFMNSKCFFIVFSILNMVIIFILAYYGNRYVLLLEGSNNPLTIISSISLFIWVSGWKKQRKMSRLIAKIAPNMLAVYIIHESLRLSRIIDISFLNGNLLYVFPAAIFILLAASLIEICRKWMYNKFWDLLRFNLTI